jgi:hypothetical protein
VADGKTLPADQVITMQQNASEVKIKELMKHAKTHCVDGIKWAYAYSSTNIGTKLFSTADMPTKMTLQKLDTGDADELAFAKDGGTGHTITLTPTT